MTLLWPEFFLNFMQFSENFGKFVCWPPGRLAPHPTGNPGPLVFVCAYVRFTHPAMCALILCCLGSVFGVGSYTTSSPILFTKKLFPETVVAVVERKNCLNP